MTQRFLSLCLVGLLVLGMSGCATAPTDSAERAEYEKTNDPLEPTNRAVFEVNDFLYRMVFRPVTKAYQYVLPEFVRNRVASIVANMEEPVIFLNNLLQARVYDATETMGRFLTNTVLGAGGSFDVASDWGMYRQQGDFGQTLHVWGFHEGPYVVLPFFGPSSVRATVGKVADMFASPWQYLVAMGSSETETYYSIASTGASGLVRMDRSMEALDSLREGSLDFYAQMRSVYRQHRNKQLGVTSMNPTDYYGDEVDDYVPLSSTVQPVDEHKDHAPTRKPAHRTKPAA